MADLTDEVRTVLLQAQFHESSEAGDPGFHVWPSRRKAGLVYVDAKLHSNKFLFTSTARSGKQQIAKYRKALTDAGFTVQEHEHIPVPRLAVSRPEEQSAHQGGPDHG
jgi:hypothetical protein